MLNTTISTNKLLKGKNAHITGSSSGIGLASAHVHAEQGINLILHGLLNEDKGNTLAVELSANYQIKPLFDYTNLMESTTIRTFMAKGFKIKGSIDIQINNDGVINSIGNFHNYTLKINWIIKNGIGNVCDINPEPVFVCQEFTGSNYLHFQAKRATTNGYYAYEIDRAERLVYIIFSLHQPWHKPLKVTLT